LFLTVGAWRTIDEALKCRPRQEIHQLGEQGLADVHEQFSEEKSPKTPFGRSTLVLQ
jgi:hypothetical protein